MGSSSRDTSDHDGASMQDMPDDGRTRFEVIYNGYSGLLLAYAARRTASVEDAADIVAETFTIAWRKLGDVPAGDEARLWLYGVARRVLANHHRGHERRARLSERLGAEGLRSVALANAEVDGTDHAQIAAAFARLSDDDRELLTLVGWDGLDRDEIATIFGCSTATIRVRLHRARLRFERHLGAAGLKRDVVTGHQQSRGASALPEPEDV